MFFSILFFFFQHHWFFRRKRSGIPVCVCNNHSTGTMLHPSRNSVSVKMKLISPKQIECFYLFTHTFIQKCSTSRRGNHLFMWIGPSVSHGLMFEICSSESCLMFVQKPRTQNTQARDRWLCKEKKLQVANRDREQHKVRTLLSCGSSRVLLKTTRDAVTEMESLAASGCRNKPCFNKALPAS